MVPAFISLIPDMDIHTAKGTSLFIILMVALTGFPRVWRSQVHRPSLRPVLFITLGALTGGYAGAAVTVNLSETTILILFISLIGFFLVRLVTDTSIPHHKRPRKYQDGQLFGVGLLAGGIGSATGTGGGSVLAPLVLLTGLLPHTQLVYVANQEMIATSLAAAPAHLLAEQSFHRFFTVGHICLGIAPIVVVFSQIGIVIGVRLNQRLRAHQRRLLLACVLLLVAIRMSYQFYALYI